MAFAPLALTLASTALSYSEKRTQANIEEEQAKVAASQTELAVTQREADRKDRLASALSSQIARSGASGVAAFEGSPLTILNDSIQREETASERDLFQSDLTALAQRSTGRARARMIRQNANLGLLQTAANTAVVG